MPTRQSATSKIYLVHGIRTNGCETWQGSEPVYRALGFVVEMVRYREFHGPALLAFLRVLLWPWVILAFLAPLNLPELGVWFNPGYSFASAALAFCVLWFQQWDWFRSGGHEQRVIRDWPLVIALAVSLAALGFAVAWYGFDMWKPYKRLAFCIGWFAFITNVTVAEILTFRWWDTPPYINPAKSFPKHLTLVITISLIGPLAFVVGWFDGPTWCWWLITYWLLLLFLALREARHRRHIIIDRLVRRLGPAGKRRHLIAHSMGTYAAVHGLIRGDHTFDSVVLIGSPLPRQFEWTPLLYRETVDQQKGLDERVSRVRNEVGGLDSIVWLIGLAPYPRDLGGGGIWGFQSSTTRTHKVQIGGSVSCSLCNGPCRGAFQNIFRQHWQHSSAFLHRRHAIREWGPLCLGYDAELSRRLCDLCVEGKAFEPARAYVEWTANVQNPPQLSDELAEFVEHVWLSQWKCLEGPGRVARLNTLQLAVRDLLRSDSSNDGQTWSENEWVILESRLKVPITLLFAVFVAAAHKTLERDDDPKTGVAAFLLPPAALSAAWDKTLPLRRL